MKKSISQNYFYNLLYQIFVILFPIITTPYLTRVLGATSLGIYGYCMSIVTCFILFGALGTVNYAQREIAYVQNDRNRRSVVFWEIFSFRIIALTISLIIFFLFFGISGDEAFYYRLFSLEIFATIFDISWLFQGLENFKKVAFRNCIVKFFSVICLFLFVKSSDDIYIYILIYCLSNFIGNISLWFQLKDYIDRKRIKLKDLKKHIKPTISLFIPQIAVSIYTILDKTMLGILYPDISEISFYEQSQKIVKIALTLITSLSAVMVPKISSTFAEDNHKKIVEYMKKTFNFVWFLALPIMFGIIAISNKFVPWFFGEGFEKVSSLMMISSPIVIFISLSTITGSQLLMSIKKQNIHSISVIVGAIINFSINLVLLGELGATGAVISTVLAECVIATIELMYIVKNKILSFKDIFGEINNYIISALVMFIFVLILQCYMPVSIFNTFIEIGLGCFIYLIFLFMLKDSFLFQVLKKIKK